MKNIATVLLVLIGISKANAIEFPTLPEPSTYSVVLVKEKQVQGYLDYTDYFGYDASGTPRVAVYQRGSYSSPIHVFLYEVYNSQGKLVYKIPPFSLEEMDYSQLVSRLRSLDSGCTVTLSLNSTNHSIVKVLQSCPVKN